jgi:hypothetical protein
VSRRSPASWKKDAAKLNYAFSNVFQTDAMNDTGNSFKGTLGWCYGKNGWCPSGACAAQAMIFPNGVQAYVLVNSSMSKVGSSLSRVLLDGYSAALT